MPLDPEGNLQAALALDRWRLWDNRLVGRVPPAWLTAMDTDPELRDARMVVELTFGTGDTLRLATEHVAVASSVDGSDHSALPLLQEEPTIRRDYQLGSGASSASAVTVAFDQELFDAALSVARGGVVAGWGEVWLVVPGMSYEQRLPILRGDMSGGVRFGASRGTTQGNELMEVEVVDPKESFNTQLPPYVVGPDRFGGFTLHESAQGERIPIVVGRYEGVPAVRINSSPTAPDFMFAYGTGWAVSLTVGVTLNGRLVSSADAATPWSLATSTDSEGTPFSFIDFAAGDGTFSWQDTDAVHVTCSQAATINLGLLGLMRYVLSRFSPLGQRHLNEELFASALPKVPEGRTLQTLINASGGSSGGVFDWVESGLLASFPMVTMCWEGGGYGPVVTDRRAAPVMELEPERFPLLDRIGLVSETPKAELRNAFVYRYRYNAMKDVYRSVLVRTPRNSAICEASRQMVGERLADPIESVYVDNDQLAAWCIDWMVEHLALPSYVVQYEGYAPLFLLLRRGDAVRLTDSDFGWARERATVEALEYQRARCVVTLRVWQRLVDLGGPARVRA